MPPPPPPPLQKHGPVSARRPRVTVIFGNTIFVVQNVKTQNCEHIVWRNDGWSVRVMCVSARHSAALWSAGRFGWF